MGHPLLIQKKKTEKPSTSLQNVLADATTVLRDSGVDSPRLDAEVLLATILDVSRSQLYTRLTEPVETGDLKRFRKLLARRARRIPLQYITGHVEFMSLDFLIKKGILVPRPETELLVEAVLERADTRQKLRIIDIGTGSGNIAVSIAAGLRDAADLLVYASDISPKALKLARLNARRHAVEDRISFHRGSLYDAFQRLGLEGQVDFLVSNPPYVPEGEFEGLQPEIRDYEDPGALVAGADGLQYYRAIAAGAHRWLRPGGWLIMELGEGQAAPVKDLIYKNGHFRDMNTVKDLNHTERVIIARSS